MIIRQPEVLVPETELNPDKMKRIERYARVCYKSEDRMTWGEDSDFLRSIVGRGHESVIEHEKVTVLFILDRGISHELVRHRIGSFSQESTRYCNYGKDKFGREITVIEPFFFLNSAAYPLWQQACEQAEAAYFALLDAGRSPQEARSILPNSLKTEIAVTFNLREWKHFFALRAAVPSHPQMRQVAIPLLLFFHKYFPEIFADIPYDRNFSTEHMAKVTISDAYFGV